MNKQRLYQKQYQNLSPQQIQFLAILQLPIVSLEKRIEEELEENPALEEEEETTESTGYFSTSSFNKNFEEAQLEDKSDTLQDFLEKQLIDLTLNEEMLFLLKYLINSLNDNGFLGRDLYSISSDLLTSSSIDVSEKDLLSALKILQSLEPVGVGAKNLQDCLLLQLKKLYPTEKRALQVISDFYTPFSNKNYELLIKKLNLSKKELRKIYHLVEQLNPLPASSFSKNTHSAEYIYADFTITTHNNRLDLQINKGNIKELKVSKYYSDLLLETKDKKTKEFLTQKLEKAKWFKESILKRENTLKKVMSAIISLQKDYFISGLECDLIPMKLADVADLVGMDISTISRVSNSKFIETHFGTFKVKELFSDAFRKDTGAIVSTKEIKRQLKGLVLTEDKLHPYTDAQLCELLGKDEFHIARRTVSKYREQIGIETSKLRRQI